MSIEKVAEIVLEKARREAEALLTEAQKRAETLLRETEAQLRQRDQGELERYRNSLREEADRSLSARTAEHNRELLVLRNGLLAEVRTQAQNRIAQQPQPQYRQWLTQQLRQLTDIPQGEIRCRADDRQLIGQIREELASQGVALGLELSANELPSAGGFVVSCPEYDLDVTLESQLRLLWGEVLPEVVVGLFGPGKDRRGRSNGA